MTKSNPSLLAQAIRVYQANMRQGTVSTKTRAEVRGGGRKPWKEKGTGRARQGSIRAPHWRGGGVVFGPKPRDLSLSLPQKMRKKALHIALSEKKITNLDIEILKVKKTKEADVVLKKIYEKSKKMPKILLITNEKNVKAFNNLPYLTIKNVNSLSAMDVISCEEILYDTRANLS